MYTHRHKKLKLTFRHLNYNYSNIWFEPRFDSVFGRLVQVVLQVVWVGATSKLPQKSPQQEYPLKTSN